ncbi:helix-turn-helix domain-containing protein [Rhizobium beringeri]
MEAYGINLSPIAARYCEFFELSDAADFEAGKCKRLSNSRTLLRRGIAAIIEAARRELGSLDEDWNLLLARLDRLRERRAQGSVELAHVVDALEALRAEAAELLGSSMIAEISTPRWRNFGLYKPQLKPLILNLCNEERKLR